MMANNTEPYRKNNSKFSLDKYNWKINCHISGTVKVINFKQLHVFVILNHINHHKNPQSPADHILYKYIAPNKFIGLLDYSTDSVKKKH